jgi:hypothetical protein
VDSEWVEHYYHELEPWTHYIPIKADLSNLIQIICWCREHDDECFRIAHNAYIYASLNFTKINLFNYVESIVYDKKIISSEKPLRYKSITPPLVLPRLPKKDFCFQSKTGYSKTLLPMKKHTGFYFLGNPTFKNKYICHDIDPSMIVISESFHDITKLEYCLAEKICVTALKNFLLCDHGLQMNNTLYYIKFIPAQIEILMNNVRYANSPLSIIFIHLDDLMTYTINDEIVTTHKGKVIIFNADVRFTIDTSPKALNAKMLVLTAVLEKI